MLRSVAEFGMPTAIAASDFVAVVDGDLCAGCGDCLERCQFEALTLEDDVCQVAVARCVGCGLCVTVCPTESLRLERRPEAETPALPHDFKDWTKQRAKERGLPETT